MTIPEGITKVPSCLLKNCTSLDEVILLNGITEVGFEAFMNCVRLQSITLPASLTKFCYEAFGNCVSLTDDVYFGGTVAEWEAVEKWLNDIDPE